MSIIDRLIAFVRRRPTSELPDDARIVELACRFSEAWATHLECNRHDPAESPPLLKEIEQATWSGGYDPREFPAGRLVAALAKLDAESVEAIKRHALAKIESARIHEQRYRATRDFADMALDDYLEATGRARQYGTPTMERRAAIESAAKAVAS